MMNLYCRHCFPFPFLRAIFFGYVIGNVISRAIVNDVLLPDIVPSISKTTISLVTRIGIEIVYLVIDSRSNGIVKWLVVDVIFVSVS